MLNEDKTETTTLRTIEGGFSEVPDGHGAFAVMGERGDTKHIWDRTNVAEINAARELFRSLTSAGYLAFHVTGKNGDKGEQMREFDPNAERVIFAPQMQGG